MELNGAGLQLLKPSDEVRPRERERAHVFYTLCLLLGQSLACSFVYIMILLTAYS